MVFEGAKKRLEPVASALIVLTSYIHTHIHTYIKPLYFALVQIDGLPKAVWMIMFRPGPPLSASPPVVSEPDRGLHGTRASLTGHM